MTLPKSERFEDLIVWQKSHALVLRVYNLSRDFPKDEVYGLAAQMRRAAVSVPANIAEGFSKRGRSDKSRYYNVAQGSLEELRYYFILARDLGYLSGSTEWNDLSEVARLLGAYIKGLKAS